MAAVCAEQGMGSTLHVAAVFLAQALQYDHIFVWDPRGAHIGQEYVDPGCGRGETTPAGIGVASLCLRRCSTLCVSACND